MRRSDLILLRNVALAALLLGTVGCNRSKRACDKLQDLEEAQDGSAPTSPVLQQLAKTRNELCVMHFDVIKSDSEADYEAVLACAELATYEEASRCIDGISPPGVASALAPGP